MTMHRMAAAAFLLSWVGMAVSARAEVTVDNAWVRATVGAGRVSAGYATIANNGAEADELVSARFAGAMMTEIHNSQGGDGMMKMEAVAPLAIPAGGKIEFKPGGYHLMIMNLQQPLKAGETITLVFVLKEQGEISVQAKVMPISATGPN